MSESSANEATTEDIEKLQTAPDAPTESVASQENGFPSSTTAAETPSPQLASTIPPEVESTLKNHARVLRKLLEQVKESPSLTDFATLRDSIARDLKEGISAAVATSREATTAAIAQMHMLKPEIEASVIEVLVAKQQESEAKLKELGDTVASDLDRRMKLVERQRELAEATLDEITELSDQQASWISRFKPGTIEQLRQRLEEEEKANDELRERLRERENRIDEAQRELAVFRSESGLTDIVTLENKRNQLKLEIDKLRNEQGGYEEVRVQRDQYLAELSDLRAAKSRYDTIHRENSDIQNLRDQIAEAQQAISTLESEKRDYQDRLQKSDRDLRQLRSRVDVLQAQLADKTQEFDRFQLQYEDVEAEKSRLQEKLQQLLDQIDAINKQARQQDERYDRIRSGLIEQLKSREIALERSIRIEFEQQFNDQVQRAEQAERAQQILAGQIDVLKGEYEKASVSARDLLKLKQQRDDIVVSTERLRNELAQLKKDYQDLRDRRVELESKIAELEARCGSLNGEIDEKRQSLIRLRDDVDKREKISNREDRIAIIRQPLPEIQTNIKSSWANISEAQWLSEVMSGIKDHGFVFPSRLVKAFHTSLKIADWSSLTVLAGVSGTGKSELPRLYSRFGGLNFLSVPVVPNWDTPADLFGFFDYMSGQFKPTELLRALDQCQRNDREGGCSETLLLVLLDEMNLARVELYFSELLSRLEGRRNEGERVSMQIDIGSGERPHPVQLGSNLLFVGTINEDESTNTLSDKVLDRSNVIYFPRPRKLVSRDVNQITDSLKACLHVNTWKVWGRQPHAILTADIRESLRSAFDELNNALRLVNRAVAHRILQITERYIANHPDVLAAGEDMKVRELAWRRAFSDQVAQKLMPKLRGISISSQRGKECLTIVEGVLRRYSDDLLEDFKQAKEGGHGQFSWCSSSYLEDSE